MQEFKSIIDIKYLKYIEKKSIDDSVNYEINCILDPSKLEKSVCSVNERNDK